MRLLKTLLISVVALAMAGTALAAKTRDEVTRTMRGTSHLASGGKVTVIVTHKSGAKRFRVVTRYDVNVKSSTRIHFAAHPCRNNRCGGKSTATTGSLSARVHHITFTGTVPVVKLGTGRTACVFVQLRDGGAGGRIIRGRHGGRGITICRKV